MRVKFSFIILALNLLWVGCCAAATDESSAIFRTDKKNTDSAEPIAESFSREMFSVSTDDMDPSESLNRIAGQIDNGYASKEQTYRSESHGSANPLDKDKRYNS